MKFRWYFVPKGNTISKSTSTIYKLSSEFSVRRTYMIQPYGLGYYGVPKPEVLHGVDRVLGGVLKCLYSSSWQRF
jgi:hypothetical protein